MSVNATWGPVEVKQEAARMRMRTGWGLGGGAP